MFFCRMFINEMLLEAKHADCTVVSLRERVQLLLLTVRNSSLSKNIKLFRPKESHSSYVSIVMPPTLKPETKQSTTGQFKPAIGPESVLIAIPTFQRSSRLRQILPHIVSTLNSIHYVELLVIDNNFLPIEEKFVTSFIEKSPYPLHYIHEPRPGVSNARNAAIKFATSRFLAFLDDDMEITENWIDGLVKVAVGHKAGIVFGPLIAKFANEADPRNAYLSPFYMRNSKQTDEGISEDAFGTGGCLIDLQTCTLPSPPFDTRLNESGGEDDMFFEALHKEGALYGWAPSAVCYECVPTERTTMKYIAKRNFGYGQGPSRIAASKGISGSLELARHMGVGLAQFFIFGSIFYLCRLLKRPSEVRYLALTARGLGKVFWFDRFKPKLYGGTPV